MRTLDNGDILFPQRGKPPSDLSNYTRDPGNPFLFHANFRPCIHLLLTTEVSPCKRVRSRWFCQLFGKTTSVPFCNSCKERQEP